MEAGMQVESDRQYVAGRTRQTFDAGSVRQSGRHGDASRQTG
jgi:hypothetical protein